jgi:hypothetical protein
LTYLHEILRVTQVLSQDPTVSVEIVKSGSFERFSKAVYAWFLKKSHRGKDKVARQRGFMIMADAEAFLDIQGRRSPAHWKLIPPALEAMIQAGYVEVLMEGLSENRLGTRDAIMVLKSMELMKHCCGKYPTVG